MPTFKKLIDIQPGDRILGIGIIVTTSSEKGITTLQARNCAHPQRHTDEAITTFVWKSDQLVDIGEQAAT